MSKAQGGQLSILHGKAAQIIHHIDHLPHQQVQAFLHNQKVRIIPYVTGSGTPMHNGFGQGTLNAIGIHMCHHIVANLPLFFLSHLVIDVLLMLYHLLNLGFVNGQSQFFFRFRQSNPKPSPGSKLLLLRKKILHLLTGIPLRKRADIFLIF